MAIPNRVPLTVFPQLAMCTTSRWYSPTHRQCKLRDPSLVLHIPPQRTSDCARRRARWKLAGWVGCIIVYMDRHVLLVAVLRLRGCASLSSLGFPALHWPSIILARSMGRPYFRRMSRSHFWPLTNLVAGFKLKQRTCDIARREAPGLLIEDLSQSLWQAYILYFGSSSSIATHNRMTTGQALSVSHRWSSGNAMQGRQRSYYFDDLRPLAEFACIGQGSIHVRASADPHYA